MSFDMMASSVFLTRREIEALSLLAQGMTALKIAEFLGVAKRTVDAHSQSAVLKLGVANATQAVAVAIRDGIISAA
jgi:LuxR family transcriptional regulator